MQTIKKTLFWEVHFFFFLRHVSPVWWVNSCFGCLRKSLDAEMTPLFVLFFYKHELWSVTSTCMRLVHDRMSVSSGQSSSDFYRPVLLVSNWRLWMTIKSCPHFNLVTGGSKKAFVGMKCVSLWDFPCKSTGELYFLYWRCRKEVNDGQDGSLWEWAGQLSRLCSFPSGSTASLPNLLGLAAQNCFFILNSLKIHPWSAVAA